MNKLFLASISVFFLVGVADAAEPLVPFGPPAASLTDLGGGLVNVCFTDGCLQLQGTEDCTDDACLGDYAAHMGDNIRNHDADVRLAVLENSVCFGKFDGDKLVGNPVCLPLKMNIDSILLQSMIETGVSRSSLANSAVSQAHDMAAPGVAFDSCELNGNTPCDERN